MKILVTGSKSGLGLAIADALRFDGHNVIDYDLQTGDDVTRPFENRGKWGELPSIHGLINCAGINHNEWFEDVTPESFERLMAVNAYSFVGMTQMFMGSLEVNKGFVINIVSNAAHIPMTSSLAYNASKAAGLMITKQMAHELTPKHGITVFSVSPNKLAGTGMSKQIEDNVIATRGWTREYAAEYQKKALMHGLESPPEGVAAMIASLISSGNWKFMSGCDIPFGK